MRIGLFAVAAALGCVPAQVLINSAGATFPYPIYARWFDEFYRLHPGAQINYQSVGSGFGIRQLTAGVLDFGASDRPLRDDEIARSKIRLLHFPTVVGAVVPVYNIPKLDLNFTAEMLDGIFGGRITRWNDPLIARGNPGARLPDAEIVVVHRSDSSGTTYILTDFLARAGHALNSRPPTTSPNWRTGIGARGNEGVVGIVKQTPYSIGYAEHIYAPRIRSPSAGSRTRQGRFVRADWGASGPRPSRSPPSMPDDFRTSIVNAPGKNAYPSRATRGCWFPATMENPEKKLDCCGCS